MIIYIYIHPYTLSSTQRAWLRAASRWENSSFRVNTSRRCASSSLSISFCSWACKMDRWMAKYANTKGGGKWKVKLSNTALRLNTKEKTSGRDRWRGGRREREEKTKNEKEKGKKWKKRKKCSNKNRKQEREEGGKKKRKRGGKRECRERPQTMVSVSSLCAFNRVRSRSATDCDMT